MLEKVGILLYTMSSNTVQSIQKIRLHKNQIPKYFLLKFKESQLFCVQSISTVVSNLIVEYKSTENFKKNGKFRRVGRNIKINTTSN